jgi:hypothetical protein
MPERMVTMVRSYKKEKDYRKDAQKLSKQGWHVMSTVEQRPRSGLGRLFMLGLLAAVFPPKPKIVVTYERTR